MRKVILIFMLLTGICSYTMAQNAMAKDTASKSKKNSSTGTTKAGNPDMRFKTNKEAKAKQDAQAAQPATPAPAASATDKKENSQAKSASAPTSGDKIVGKDAKGRSIYQGPKGGQYIINSSGGKDYIKKG